MLSTTIIPEINEGIALDIDQTLSRTTGYLVKEMQKKFGNPENLSVEDMVAKYRYTQNVPYRQNEEAIARMDDVLDSNTMQEELSIMEGAKEFVNKINTIIPITAYITVRPIIVREGTQNRLQRHGFPIAPIIMKPESICREEGNERKAKILEKLYPKIVGIVDDNAGLVDYITKTYKGMIFLYSHDETKQEHQEKNVTACTSRNDVYREVKKHFEKK